MHLKRHTIKFPVIISFLLVLFSCSPRISTNISKSYAPLDYTKEVVVIQRNQPEPENAELIGEVKIGDTGFSTKCTYDVVIDKALLEARKAGGNALKIIEHKYPSFESTCHRIKAKILRLENTEPYKEKEEENELLDVDYAILKVYRFRGTGSLVGYNLYLGDSLLCRVKNNFKKTIHINKEGLNVLWAKTESKREVPIDLVKGKTYYLRCGISMGVMVGHPVLEFVDYRLGKAEFETFNAKHQ